MTFVYIYLGIGLLLGLLVETLAKNPEYGIGEILGNSLLVRAEVVLLWPVVVFGILAGLAEDNSGPTPTGT